MTLTASTSLLMSAVHRRWMTVREMLSIQGFPTDVSHTHGKPCSSYALRHSLQYHGRPFQPWPSRHALCNQSGNSMHTSVSGVMVLFILTQVMFDEHILSLQRFVLNRSMRSIPSPVDHFYNATLHGPPPVSRGDQEPDDSSCVEHATSKRRRTE